jgi:hypothetical protein
LKNPSRDIGRGTIYAVATSFILYCVLIFVFAAAFSRETLQENYVLFQEQAIVPGIILMGILVSSASSGLGSMFGGSRVLQALARDKLIPFAGPFAKGSRDGDEPRRAVFLTWLIAQLCTLAGDLDFIAPYITSFFCLSYAAVNLCCFLLQVSGTPNWRPEFKYFTGYMSLIGFVLNMAVMFYLDVVSSVISMCLLTAIFLYILKTAPPVAWGDVRQALIFHQVRRFLSAVSSIPSVYFISVLTHSQALSTQTLTQIHTRVLFNQVRKYLLRLDATADESGKRWRPNLLLVVDAVHSPLIGFCNDLKKGGLYVLGQCVVEAPSSSSRPSLLVSSTSSSSSSLLSSSLSASACLRAHRVRDAWHTYIRASRRVKLFPQVGVGRTMRDGIVNLMLLCGLGAMTPNTLVLPFYDAEADAAAAACDGGGNGGEDDLDASDYMALLAAASRRSRFRSPVEYVGVIDDARALSKNVCVCANFDAYAFNALYAGDYGAACRHRERAAFAVPSARRASFAPVFDGGNGGGGGGGRGGGGGCIDVWIIDEADAAPSTSSWQTWAATPLLCLQLAYILTKSQKGSDASVSSSSSSLASSSSSSSKNGRDLIDSVDVDFAGADGTGQTVRMESDLAPNSVKRASTISNIFGSGEGGAASASVRVLRVLPSPPMPESMGSASGNEWRRALQELRSTVAATETERVRKLLQESRVDYVEINVVFLGDSTGDDDDDDDGDTFDEDGNVVFSLARRQRRSKALNALITAHSAAAQLVVMPLPLLPPSSATENVPASSAQQYLAGLAALVHDLPPTAMVAFGEATQFMSTDI